MVKHIYTQRERETQLRPDWLAWPGVAAVSDLRWRPAAENERKFIYFYPPPRGYLPIAKRV